MPHPWTHGEFYWNELVTRDAERDKKFYSGAIGWTFEAMPMPGMTYWIILSNMPPTRAPSQRTLSRNRSA